MSEDTTATVDQPEAVQQPDTEPAPDLTVQDLQALKTIIDVASQRGAFKPNEMMTVGQVYTKLEMFLNAISTQQGTQEKGE